MQLDHYPKPDRFDWKYNWKDFAANLKTLGHTICETYDDYEVVRNSSSFPFLFFVGECIDDNENWNGDNSDTVHIGNFQWEMSTETYFYVAFGVNHEKTNMAKHCNAYNFQKRVCTFGTWW